VPPAFSDYGYVALGLPRNADLPANADPRYFDLGLCGPYRTGLAEQPDTCGKFRTPSLRNVATRQVFFHNGVVHALRDAVAFYATRDTQPERWYPRAHDGALVRFNDLPPADRANVELGPPFGRSPHARPSLSDADIDAVVAFLATLSDADVGAPPPRSARDKPR
jgi:cytochrome c peroxidase